MKNEMRNEISFCFVFVSSAWKNAGMTMTISMSYQHSSKDWTKKDKLLRFKSHFRPLILTI